MDTHTQNPTSFRLPHTICPFSVSYHPNGDAIAADSDKWFENGCHDFTETKRRRLCGIKAGQLAAHCYSDVEDCRLRVVGDFLSILFHLDDLSDNLSTTETITFADIVMNAFASPHIYSTILPCGTKLPEEEPDASALIRE
jgi:hypothetical protein